MRLQGGLHVHIGVQRCAQGAQVREDAKPNGGSELEPDDGTDREPVHVADDGTDRVAEHEPDREPDRSANEQPDERADRARLRRQEHRR